MSNEKNAKKKLVNYALDSPCQHFVLGPFLHEAFNLTEKACKLNKVLQFYSLQRQKLFTQNLLKFFVL